jgi:hypothetical protein
VDGVVGARRFFGIPKGICSLIYFPGCCNCIATMQRRLHCVPRMIGTTYAPFVVLCDYVCKVLMLSMQDAELSSAFTVPRLGLAWNVRPFTVFKCTPFKPLECFCALPSSCMHTVGQASLNSTSYSILSIDVVPDSSLASVTQLDRQYCSLRCLLQLC